MPDEIVDNAVSTEGSVEAPVSSGEAVEASSSTTEAVQPKTFSEEYVKELREEAANYRIRAKKFEEPLGKYAEDEQEIWLNIINEFAEDPKSAASKMKDLVDAVMAEQEDAGVSAGDPEFLTKADVAKMLEEQQLAAEQKNMVASIHAEASQLGYNVNSENVDERLDFEDLISVAKTLPDGNLAEAHKILEARKQRIIDQYVNGKREDAGKTPIAPVAGGSAPSQERNKGEALTWEDVQARAVARAEAAQNR